MGETKNILNFKVHLLRTIKLQVQYSSVKGMTNQEKVELVNIINESLMTGHIEDDMKFCKMTVLPKPYKDHQKLKGYRVITMANIWVKIMEKIAAQRLTKDLEE